MTRTLPRLAWWAIGLAATLVFAVGILWYYHFRPTVGAAFLIGGWAALLGSGWLLIRAAASFDLRVTEDTLSSPTGERRAELEQEKKLLLKAIKELEFDQAMGKVDDRDAADVVGRYRARAVEIMQLLDAEGGGKAYQAAIEKELARRLGAAEQAVEKVVEPGVCAACQTRNDDDAVFCKKCGAKVSA